jgi:hypothetical protein
LQLLQLRIERRKHLRRLQYSGLSQRVEQRAFARVGVPHQRDHGHRDRLAPLPLLAPDLPHRLQLLLHMVDAQIDLAPIGLELCFARPARPDSAAQLRHCLASSCKARKLIFKLRQLHLQLALAGPRVARKNVQDQLRPVDDAARQFRLKIT